MTRSNSDEPAGAKLAHHEIIALALLQLGGDVKSIDTEFVAVRANELAPGRFTWIHFKDQINIHNIKTCLWKSKEGPEALVLGSDVQGWMLTEAGVELARALWARWTAPAPTSTRIRPRSKESQWHRGERERLLATDAFRAYSQGGESSVSEAQAAAVFRLNDYVTGDARDRKITRLVNAFGSDPLLGEMIVKLARRLQTR